jgi:hypothetical protein
MTQSMTTGLVLVALGITMFVLALPRQGQVVGFLRRDSLQAIYMILIVFVLALGLIITLSNL